jgi:hypothetical protein
LTLKKIQFKFQFQISFFFFEILNLKFLTPFSKNHISVSVLTTPINFWSMTDRTPVFHLDALNLNGPQPRNFMGSRPSISMILYLPMSAGDPHVLVVGDPGLGKSQMLQSCSNVAPRSVFVTATGATATGLTVTMTRGKGNEFVLEAGNR